ncbi:MAG: phosphatidate cytidylyltransferase [Polyangiaceae bacterium]
MRSNLAARLLTAAVAAPLLLSLIFLGPSWGWAAFVGVACLVGSIELYGMTHPGDRVSQVVCTALTLGVMAVMWFFGTDARALLALVMLLPVAAVLLTLLRLGEMKTAALRMMAVIFGPIWLGGGLGSAILLHRDGGKDGPGFVLLALMLSWLSDTGAYFAGRFLGKHKLYEAVSPKKTVEGAIGGIGGAVAGAMLAHFFYMKSLPIAHALGLAVVAGAIGQAGDLGESLLKRSFGVKDSGGIIPGHGGLLDRVDALLFTASISYVYLRFVRG